MKLRGIDFGHVLDASGVRGWFGEGYSFHRWVPFGLDFKGSTFVAKTTTLNPRPGQASMSRNGWRPRVIGQRAIRISWRKGAALNAFGLPGPGFRPLLDTGQWQRLSAPFFVSFRTVEQSLQDSLGEVRAFVQILKKELPNFAAPIGVQVNFSCPNVNPRDHLANFASHLNEYQALDVPIMVKLSAALPVELAIAVAEHQGCDALCVSNSIAWGELPDKIDWASIFGDESPLAEFGGGGLSGAPLLPVVAEWVREARLQGLRKPINAGGGILRSRDVDVLFKSGASSIFVGSVAILRGWRLQWIIRRGNHLYSGLTAQESSDSAPVLCEDRRPSTKNLAR